MLRNKDGTPFTASGKIRIFDPNSNKHDLFNQWDLEALKMGGTSIYYHEVIIDHQNFDKIYFEDRGKIFNPNPVELFSSYEPQADQFFQMEFGIDGISDIVLDVNYKHTFENINHPPVIGSWIRTPHLDRDWILVNTVLGEFGHWGALRLKMVLKKFQDDIHTVRDTSIYKDVNVEQDFHKPKD